MSVTWQRARATARALHCGYCGPTRPIADGEVYAVIENVRRFVRCAACATARWGLTVPSTVAEEIAPARPVMEPAPSFERVGAVGVRVRWRFDAKARAAGDA